MHEKWFISVVYAVIALFCLFSFLPFWMMVIGSFTGESELMSKGIPIIPNSFSLDAYTYLLQGQQVWRSYGVTLFVMIVGTLFSLYVTASFAYVIAHRKVRYRNALAFLTYFTIIFGGGIVGFYILVANWLQLKDSIWALVLPYLMNPFYAFILVSFFRMLPYEINEAATIDGAGDLRVFFRIILPISLPALATVGLFYALQFWNDWYLALLFIDDHRLHPLQLMIRQIMSNINMASYIGSGSSNVIRALPSHGLRLATVCVTIGPIIFLYPFVQRYFVKGLTIGAIKG